MAHYISSFDTDEIIENFDTFDKDKIKDAIVKHLQTNPKDTVALYKVSTNKKTYGDDLIDFFENHPKTGKTCKVITKGTKEYFKELV
jgi:hypothetical protein